MESRLLTAREVCQRLGLARSTLYKQVRAGRLPAPVHVTPTTPRWRSDEIEDWIESASAKRS